MTSDSCNDEFLKPNTMIAEESEQATIETKNSQDNIIQEQQSCSENSSEILSFINESVYVFLIFY